MTKQEKIKKLIETGYANGGLDNNQNLWAWMQDANYDPKDGMIVQYEFLETGVSYIVAEDEKSLQSSSSLPCDDKWSDFDDDEIDYFYKLL